MAKRITDERLAKIEVDDGYPLSDLESELMQALKAEREHTNRECNWKNDDPDYGVWEGDCGIEWVFNSDWPEENDCKYCPLCGGKVTLND